MQEGTENKKTRTGEGKCCKGVDDSEAKSCCEEVDPRVAKAQSEADFLLKCFDLSSKLIMETGMPKCHGFVKTQMAELETKIALAIYQRSATTPGQEQIFKAAQGYLTILMKEKEADSKRQQEIRDTMAPIGYAPFVSSEPPCKHPGLFALREALMCEDHLSHAGHKAIDALSVLRPPHGDIDALICPQCRALVAADLVKSGKLWEGVKAAEPETDEVADDEEKEA